MFILLMALNILAGIFLVCVVLLQSGKGAEMGAAFGGASSTVFGPSGASTFMTKLTTVTAAVFMLTSLALAIISARQESVFDGLSEPVTQSAPPLAPIAPVATPGEAPGAASEQAATATESGQGQAATSQAAAAAESGQAAATGEPGKASAPAPEPAAQGGQAAAAAPAPAQAPAGDGSGAKSATKEQPAQAGGEPSSGQP